MICRPLWTKITGILLLVPLLFVTTPFSTAGTIAPYPLGTIVASRQVTIGHTAAPTGTTVFAGDRVESDDPALIKFSTGSRIEMTKATANFSRDGEDLVVQVDRGLFRFVFDKGDQVQIDTGDYRFTSQNGTGNSGELGLNPKGQIVMNLVDGAFTVLNKANGNQTLVTAVTPFAVMDQSGQGSVVRYGRVLSDNSLALTADELKGQCIVVGSEAFAITGNTESRISVNGTWDIRTGSYAYKVLKCTEEALIQAGASEESARNAVVTAVFGVSPPPKSNAARNAAIIAGVAGAGVAVPLVLKLTEEEKSPSSR